MGVVGELLSLGAGGAENKLPQCDKPYISEYVYISYVHFK